MAGTKNATVSILTNDPDFGVFTFDITAEATGSPEIEVRGQVAPGTAFVPIADGDESPSGLDGTEFVRRAPMMVL